MAAALLITSCVTGGQHLESMSSLGSDEIVVAGKIVLDPPLGKDEQRLGMTGEYMRNLVYFFFTKELLKPKDAGIGNLNDVYSSKLGEPFFVAVKRMDTFYYSAPRITMDTTQGDGGWMYLPGGVKYEVPKDARAVSIGTIVYHRDEYSEIKKVDLQVDDPAIQQAFRSQFGGGTALVTLKPQLRAEAQK